MGFFLPYWCSSEGNPLSPNLFLARLISIKRRYAFDHALVMGNAANGHA